MNLVTPITPIFRLITPITPVIRHTTNSTAEAEVMVSATLIILSQILTLNTLALQPAHLTKRDFSKELINLAKIYIDKSKYTRQDNNFDFKLIIFHDLCGRVSIPNEAKVKAYLIMLSNLVLNYYYTNLRNIT